MQAREIRRERRHERRAREAHERRRPGSGEAPCSDADSACSGSESDEEDPTGLLPFDETKDYYSVLGLDRAATLKEVQRAYKRLALVYHPDKQRHKKPHEQLFAKRRFEEVGEAAKVLSDRRTRRAYDKALDDREASSGRRYGAPLEFRRRRTPGVREKGDPTEVPFSVPLSRLYSGGVERVAFTRRVFASNNTDFEEETKVFHIIVKQGTAPGESYIYEDEGDESPDTLPGDVVFRLRVKEENGFSRRGGNGGKDLQLTLPPLRAGDALFAARVRTVAGAQVVAAGSALRARMLLYASHSVESSITALLKEGDGARQAVLDATQEQAPAEACLPGMGMPDPSKPLQRPPGDLYVRAPLNAGCELDAPPRVACAAAPRPLWLVSEGGVSAMRLRAAAADIMTATRKAARGELLPRRLPPAPGFERRRSPSNPSCEILRVVCVMFDPGGAAQARPSDQALALLHAIAQHATEDAAVDVRTIGVDGSGSAGLASLDDELLAAEEADVLLVEAAAAKVVCAEGGSAFEEEHQAMCRVAGGEWLDCIARAYWAGASLVALGAATPLVGMDAWVPGRAVPLPIVARCHGGGDDLARLEALAAQSPQDVGPADGFSLLALGRRGGLLRVSARLAVDARGSGSGAAAALCGAELRRAAAQAARRDEEERSAALALAELAMRRAHTRERAEATARRMRAKQAQRTARIAVEQGEGAPLPPDETVDQARAIGLEMVRRAAGASGGDIDRNAQGAGLWWSERQAQAGDSSVSRLRSFEREPLLADEAEAVYEHVRQLIMGDDVEWRCAIPVLNLARGFRAIILTPIFCYIPLTESSYRPEGPDPS